jgi:hypothetical protein
MVESSVRKGMPRRKIATIASRRFDVKSKDHRRTTKGIESEMRRDKVNFISHYPQHFQRQTRKIRSEPKPPIMFDLKDILAIEIGSGTARATTQTGV